MLEWTILILLLLFGLSLIIVEMIFVPGTTFVGIIGFLCLVGGIYSAYSMFGNQIGNLTLIGSGAFLVLAVAYVLKTKTWRKMGLEKTIDGRVNEDVEILVTKDCIAKAVSDLRPIGTIEFENQQYEATTQGQFVESGSTVRVIKVNNREITVEKTNK